MKIERWVPEIACKRPRRWLGVYYRVPGLNQLPSRLDVVDEALRAADVRWTRLGETEWSATLPWHTMVFGLVRREVDESVEIRIVAGTASPELRVSCLPVETHTAHAVGLAGVLVLATTVWIMGGWTAGMPAGLTTMVAGGVWADVTRTMALTVLERRLQRLTSDLGSALWPGIPAEVLPYS